jgi:hypothetical protein
LSKNNSLTRQRIKTDIQYARAHTPALASVLMSDHVRTGDSLDLPVPFPQSWPQTVSYIYAGREEMLTDEVRLNIWYLGGKP